MTTKIQLRRGTATAWTTANPVLALGEPGFETDTGEMKYGNGVAAWSALPYYKKWKTAVNIRDFGAVGDSVTDDTAAIQAALNIGGRVYIPPAAVGFNYKITAPLLISVPTQLFGMGVLSQIVASAAFTATDDILRIIPAAAAQRALYSLSNFVLGAVATSRHAVHVDLTTVTGVVGLGSFDMDRMYFNPTTNGKSFKMTNPSITEGFLLSSIRGCIIYSGIQMERCGDSVIISENAFGGSNLAIELGFTGGAAQCVIEKNNIVTAGGAIVLHNALQTKILHNQIEQNVAYTGSEAAMITLKGDLAQISSAHIQGNNLNTLGNVANCISVQAATNTLIENNDMVSSGTHVLVGAAAVRTTISKSNKFQNLAYAFVPMVVVDTGNSTAGPYVNGPTSIRDFGAGGALIGIDSTAAIQAALNVGGDVYIPPLAVAGDYYAITSPLTITKPVRLFGAGPHSQIIALGFAGTSDVLNIIPAAGTQRIMYVLENFVLGVSGGGGRHCVHIDLTTVSNPSLFMFDMNRVYMNPCGGYSLKLTNPSNVNGFYASSIRGCTFNNGVFMQQAGSNVIFSENSFAGANCALDLSFATGASQCVIEKNNIASVGGAIILHKADQVKILRNTIVQSAAYIGSESACIALKGDTSQLTDIQIEGNSINTQGFLTYCIDVNAATNTLVTGNSLVAATHLRVGAAAVGTIIAPTKNNFKNLSYVAVDMAVTLVAGQTATAGPWIVPTLQNSWVAFDAGNFPLRFSKNDAGIVTLQAAVMSGTTTAGTAILTLPVGFRPINTNFYFSISAYDAGVWSAGHVAVTANGQVQYFAGGNTQFHINLTFRAEG